MLKKNLYIIIKISFCVGEKIYKSGQKFTSSHGRECQENLGFLMISLNFFYGGMIVEHTSLMTLKTSFSSIHIGSNIYKCSH